MAIPDSLQHEKLAKGRRTRRTHVKVKTGCLTCKLRRKKCDETRPYCLRCTKTGRTCDGYPQQPHESSTSIPSPSSPYSSCISKFNSQTKSGEKLPTDYNEQTTLLSTDTFNDISIYRAPPIVTFSNDIDSHCFDFFRYNTGLQLESFFDSSMWKNTVVQAALSHPVALMAVIAVGAVHQRFNHGISREAFEYCAIADKLYRKAMKGFIDYRNSDPKAPSFNENCMMISMLFALFEGIQGNFEKSVQFMTLGLKSMWNRPFTVTHTESGYRQHEVTPRLLSKLLRKLYARATRLFGSPPKVTAYTPGASLPPIPNRFWTLDEARDSIFTEAEWILQAPLEFWCDETKRQGARRLYVARVFDWSVAYAEMVQSQGERTIEQKHIGLFLKIVRDATHLLLYVIFLVQPQPILNPTTTNLQDESDDADSADVPKDLFIASSLLDNLISNRADLSARFTRVWVLAEARLNDNSPFNYASHSYNCDTALYVHRKPVVTPESSEKMRYALERLCNTPLAGVTDECAWKVLSVYRLAERLASVEEHAVIAAAEDLIPKHLDPQWVDITAFLEERKILLRYCRPDGSGDYTGKGLIWVQEWMAF